MRRFSIILSLLLVGCVSSRSNPNHDLAKQISSLERQLEELYELHGIQDARGLVDLALELPEEKLSCASSLRYPKTEGQDQQAWTLGLSTRDRRHRYELFMSDLGLEVHVIDLDSGLLLEAVNDQDLDGIVEGDLPDQQLYALALRALKRCVT